MTESTWSWPVANDPPGYLGDGCFLDVHPTRYEWRSDVEQWARYLVDTFNVWCNTYHDKPPGMGLEVASTDPDGKVWYIKNTSFDVWGPQGRGDPIDSTLGQQVFDTLFNYPDPPTIHWIIWQGTMYWERNNRQGEPYQTHNMHEAHYDHIHVTYK